jgi:hypothetical protein
MQWSVGKFEDFDSFSYKIAELFGRQSQSPRTSLKSADSDFENTLDSDSACTVVKPPAKNFFNFLY